MLLGFVIALAGQAVRFSTQSRAAAARFGIDIDDREAVMRTLRTLLAGAAPGDPASPSGALTGSAHTVSFVATLPAGVAARGTGEADVTLAVDGRGNLALTWRPHYRRWIVPLPPPAEQVLLPGVAGIELGYLGGDPAKGVAAGGASGWRTGWTGRELPRLVRLRVVFAAGDPRHWPDLIVAPMRQGPGP